MIFKCILFVHHADQAARIWWGQASRILRARKSKHYGAALAHLERGETML
jgi:hypothetical protein